MQCKEIQDLISDYSVGLIESRRKVQVEKHLAVCASCTAELERLEQVLLMVEEVDAVEPPAGLWNGVRNRIAEPVPPQTVWNRVLSTLHLGRKGWSVGFATMALLMVMLFAHIHDPGSDDSYAANEYMQGHVVHATQELLADQAALHSIAAVAHREQVGGGKP